MSQSTGSQNIEGNPDRLLEKIGTDIGELKHDQNAAGRSIDALTKVLVEAQAKTLDLQVELQINQREAAEQGRLIDELRQDITICQADTVKIDTRVRNVEILLGKIWAALVKANLIDETTGEGPDRIDWTKVTPSPRTPSPRGAPEGDTDRD
ncbi:hypothetical protein PG993_006962 [Apiospora rasikravindrae]|uniref:Uncharacterized protein n=1 Tax=Apiospora rasikravindrae TaxID=990691 RepID=A0ABR1SW44_9PEZI